MRRLDLTDEQHEWLEKVLRGHFARLRSEFEDEGIWLASINLTNHSNQLTLESE